MLTLYQEIFLKYAETAVIKIDQVSAFMDIISQWQKIGTKI